MATKARHQTSDEGIWLVSFMHHDLGYFDLQQKTLQPRQSVRHEVVTHVLGTFLMYVPLPKPGRNRIAFGVGLG